MISAKSNVYGILMILEGVMVLVPLALLPFYPGDAVYLPFFAVPGGVSILLGRLLFFRRKTLAAVFEERESSRVVLFAWGYGFLLAALPFLGLRDYRFTQILFESVSGLTTTGLSVLDVERMAHIYLFYRSFLQFMGGVGFVMMILVFIQDKDSMEMYSAEGHPDKLMPNIGMTAKVILLMYGGFLGVGTILLRLGGMTLFDSVIHAMCALSTGGFSNRAASIGAYHSIRIELVTVLLMLIGTTNFAALLLLLRRKFRQFSRVSEIRFLAVLVALFVPVMTLFLTYQNGYGISESLRLSFFNAFSALSTTGYATCDYSTWGAGAIGVMILLMLIGGGAGSTAGGIKLSRVYLVLRSFFYQVKRRFMPERQIQNLYYVKPIEGRVKIQGQPLEEAGTYMGMYLLLYICGTLLLTLTAGCSLTDAMFEFASALGTVGLSIGVTGPAANDATLFIEIAGMLLGRLEIFTVFLGIVGLRKRIKRF
ncbi:MAG: TrkH family potassium uptake protein [Roseburia sp.]|nr:TrkH family potassium uptake protein [Roseburia sp.]